MARCPKTKLQAGSYGGRAVGEVSLIIIFDDESIREATKTLLRSAGSSPDLCIGGEPLRIGAHLEKRYG
jgi:hypothetical protein